MRVVGLTPLFFIWIGRLRHCHVPSTTSAPISNKETTEWNLNRMPYGQTDDENFGRRRIKAIDNNTDGSQNWNLQNVRNGKSTFRLQSSKSGTLI